MAYLFTPPNLSSGVDDAIIDVASSVTAFPIMILVFVYFVVLLGGSGLQKGKTGKADYPAWFLMSGVSITVLSLIFTIKAGVIDIVTLGIVIAITIMSALWFFLSKAKGEI